MNADGCDVTADHILVTNGAKQGIDLVCRLLLDEGDAIVVTAPTYFTAVPIFRNFGVEFIGWDRTPPVSMSPRWTRCSSAATPKASRHPSSFITYPNSTIRPAPR